MDELILEQEDRKNHDCSTCSKRIVRRQPPHQTVHSIQSTLINADEEPGEKSSI